MTPQLYTVLGPGGVRQGRVPGWCREEYYPGPVHYPGYSSLYTSLATLPVYYSSLHLATLPVYYSSLHLGNSAQCTTPAPG